MGFSGSRAALAAPIRWDGRLFADLHESLGDDASSAGFGRFYKATLGELPNEDCMDVESSFCELINAFVIHADEKSATIAEPIIRRHYYGE